MFASAAPEDPQADFMVITRIGTSGDAAATADGPFDVSQSLRDHLSALGVTDIVVDSLEVDGRPASRTSYRRPISGQNDPGSVGMSVLVAGETTDWLITISTAQPAPNDVVDTILGSFQLFET